MTLFKFSDYPFYRNPWAEYERLRREMEMWPTRFFGESVGGRDARVFPPLNLSEDAENIYVNAELPGVAADALAITLEGDTLTISGERTVSGEKETASFHRREISRGRFSRAVTLPTRIEGNNVNARSENGILTITLPKADDVKPKKITVHAV